MQVILTFDYELFFGTNTGSVQKCIIEPTDRLLAIARKLDIPLVFFVDIGFLIKLQEYKQRFPELEADFESIRNQLSEITALNGEVQLHIHPAAAHKACRMIASVAEPNFDTTVQEAVVVIWFELV